MRSTSHQSNEEAEALRVLEAHGLGGMPIDVFEIVRRETCIELAAMPCINDRFSGRIEYHADLQRFILFYPDHPLAEQMGRIRFSIAHELGHYFLDHHRERLLAGDSHNSEGGFICERALEKEADCFAACLLMPERPFARRFRDRGFLTLEEIITSADEVMVSREAFAIRYAQLATETCAVVVSTGGRVLYCASSGDAKYQRCSLRQNDRIEAAPMPTRAEPLVQSSLPVQSLFPDTYLEGNAWIESTALGYGNRILSLVSFEESDTED
jgi:hypothetical protein